MLRKLTIILLLISCAIQAQLTTNTSLTPDDLIKNVLVGKGVTVSNVTYVGQAEAVGQFNGVNSNIGIAEGIILSTGTVLDNVGAAQKNGPVGPNNKAGGSTNWSAPGDTELKNLIGDDTFDAAILEFDFIPQGDTVEFSYVFASEEYPEFVFSFNDVFAFFISGPGIVGGVQNLAVVPGTTNPVSINEINATTNAHLFVANGDGTTAPQISDSTVTNFDGFTVPLTAISKVIPCETYHLKIAIADVVDGSFDSGVFLKGGSLSSNPQFETTQTATVDVGTPNLIPEGCSDGVLELKRTEDLWSTLSIDYRVLGSADNGVDFTTLSGTVSFAPNQEDASVIIIPTADAMVEGDESVILRFPNPDVCIMDSLDYNFTITELAPMTSKLDSTTVNCPGDKVTIDANFDGGFSPFTYSWSNGADQVSTEVSPNATSSFQFTVTDVCGTNTSNDFKVKVPLFNALSLTMPNDTVVGCSGVDVELSPVVTGGAGGYNYIWSSGPTTSSIEPQILSTTTFDLNVSDACGNSANGSVEVVLDYPELKVEILNDTVVCPNDSVLFFANASGGVPPYTYVWENGNLTSSSYFTSDVSKIINISITDSCGIIPTSDSVELNIQKPTAIFSHSVRLETEELIYFYDQSEGAIASYDWDLGNGVTSDIHNPTNVYIEDSLYEVSLTVTDSLGCVDSITRFLDILPPLYFWVPNAFTPEQDGDDLNNVFLPKGVGIAEYSISIFNRWGQEIFTSDDINDGWDGNFNSGKPAPQDVYVYKISLVGESGKEIDKMGRVSLIR